MQYELEMEDVNVIPKPTSEILALQQEMTLLKSKLTEYETRISNLEKRNNNIEEFMISLRNQAGSSFDIIKGQMNNFFDQANQFRTKHFSK